MSQNTENVNNVINMSDGKKKTEGLNSVVKLHKCIKRSIAELSYFLTCSIFDIPWRIYEM